MSDIDERYRFSLLLHETARSWRHHLDRRLRHLGLSQSQWLVLLKLPPEGSTQKKLAEAVGVEGPTMVGLLDRLERKGWIERCASTDDRRNKRVKPTPKALEARAAVQELATALREDILSGFDEARVQQCAETLIAIRRRMEELDD